MGERAKKKRTEASKARKAQIKKATEQASEFEIPASQSKAGNSKAAPSSRVTSSSSASAATRHSTRLLSSSLKPESSGRHTSAEGHDDERIATRPKRLAAANSLLQQLKISEIDVGSEEDPDGKSNNEIDAITVTMLLILKKIRTAIVRLQN